eukprot:g11022.t1
MLIYHAKSGKLADVLPAGGLLGFGASDGIAGSSSRNPFDRQGAEQSRAELDRQRAEDMAAQWSRRRFPNGNPFDQPPPGGLGNMIGEENLPRFRGGRSNFGLMEH